MAATSKLDDFMIKKQAIFLSNLGLGDHLIMNALVRDIAKDWDKLIVIAKHHNVASCKFMWSDVPNILVVGTEGDEHAIISCKYALDYTVIYNGLFKVTDGFDLSRWDSEFYRQAGIPFKKSWDAWKVPECASRPYPNKPYAFVHADERRGFTINTDFMDRNLHIVSNEDARSDNIFAWTEVLRNATEIHCIESCFAILVDRLDGIKAKRLVLHAYCRKSRPPIYRKQWEILH